MGFTQSVKCELVTGHECDFSGNLRLKVALNLPWEFHESRLLLFHIGLAYPLWCLVAAWKVASSLGYNPLKIEKQAGVFSHVT